MPYTPPPELAGLSLSDVAALVAARKLPPVETWAPEHSGDSEMRIAADGRWYHQDGEIRRPAMVRAFSSLLMRDENGLYWLVTPSQKLSIVVEDAPFRAIDMKREGDDLAFRLNTDEFVIADRAHPILARGDHDTPAIYLGVRGRLEARLDRSTWLALAEMALAEDELAVRSGGMSFSLIPA